MRYQWCLRKRFISTLLGVGLLANVFVFVSSPTVALAIPTAGDYVFTAGLDGTFASTGTTLTLWDFGQVGDPYRVTSNLSVLFPPTRFSQPTHSDFWMQSRWIMGP